MKLNQIFEDGAVTGTGATTGAGDVAGFRGRLFGSNKLLKRKVKIGDTKIIRYHNENNWNVR